jgi:uncharacterized protein (TIGR00251 family)
MSFTDAIRPAKDSVMIDIEVMPGAKKTMVSGYNQWRKRIGIRICQPARDGKANKELVYSLAQLFGVDSTDVRITAGRTSNKKSVSITGISLADAIKVLGSRID